MSCLGYRVAYMRMSVSHVGVLTFEV
uniref:Uncharacterized protein n=1 Tax=Anguilla anguilla TaxID=7936 RepID=A0A0E9QLI3_ANGAN